MWTRQVEFGDDTADTTSHGYGRSFSLADANDGDQFDLKVCLHCFFAFTTLFPATNSTQLVPC